MTHTGTPNSAMMPAFPLQIQRVCSSYTENTFSSCGILDQSPLYLLYLTLTVRQIPCNPQVRHRPLLQRGLRFLYHHLAYFQVVPGGGDCCAKRRIPRTYTLPVDAY